MTKDPRSPSAAAGLPDPSQTAARRWLLVLLGLGVGWRVLRYALGFPFWGDEAYLNTSILHRGYADLLEPLHYFQIAPLLYLWVQRTVCLVFGGGEHALRAVPLLAGVGALLLFWRLARTYLEPIAASVAVGFFACSYYLVRHTCESKPYATDLLAATVLIWLAVRWHQAPNSGRRALLSIAATLPAIWLSYPAIFVACGVGLLMFVVTIRSSRTRVWIAWLAYSALVAASFLVFLAVFASIHSERAADTWLEDYWRESFPPRSGIAALFCWLVKIHTGRMFAYPHGGPNFASSLTTILFVAGAVTLLRRRQGRFVVLFVGTALAALFAAAIERYPYGGSVRVSIFLAPLICLIAAVGMTTFIDHAVPRRGRDVVRGGVGISLAALALLGMTRDLLLPYKSVEDLRMRSVMWEVAQRLSPGDLVAIVNPQEGQPGPPDGPKLHQVLRYYLDLYSPAETRWRRGGRLPADADWIIAYHDDRFGPDRERVAELASVSGLRIISRRSHSLSQRWPSVLTVYRCTPPPHLSARPVSGK